MKPWEFKPKRDSPSALDFQAWAAHLLDGREFVYMETPKGPDTLIRAFEKVTDAERLAEMRRQAEEWGVWWIVWSDVTRERELLDRKEDRAAA